MKVLAMLLSLAVASLALAADLSVGAGQAMPGLRTKTWVEYNSVDFSQLTVTGNEAVVLIKVPAATLVHAVVYEIPEPVLPTNATVAIGDPASSGRYRTAGIATNAVPKTVGAASNVVYPAASDIRVTVGANPPTNGVVKVAIVATDVSTD